MSAAAGVPSAPTSETTRVTAPLGRRACVVTEHERLGAYSVISVADRDGPVPEPGQFYMLANVDRWGAGEDERPYLPRAFSVLRHDGRATVQFMLEAVGPGTERLTDLEEGDEVWLLGPLGVGFSPPQDGRRAVLAGGGVGTAPLALLSDRLASTSAAGDPPLTFLGFRDEAHARGGAALLPTAQLTTDDGSVGRRALITAPLRETLTEDPHATVYACGPPAMLEAVRVLCAELGVPAQLALESGMACGYGACFGCVVPTVDGLVRLCVDGPVLDAVRVESCLVPGTGHDRSAGH